MHTSLNADAALRAYLPPKSWEGEAQHRFVFRTKEGDEEPLLARLAVVRPAMRGRQLLHCVILRPENAEAERLFVVQRSWHYGDPWMTLRSAQRFDWALFERNLNGSGHRCHVSRFCLERDGKRDVLLRLDSYGWGEIYDSGGTDLDISSENFIWLSASQSSHDQLDIKFLRQSHADFERQFRDQWENRTSEIRTALMWQYLDTHERDALAFRCQYCDWSSLIAIAKLVLRLRLGVMKRPPHETCEWLFTDSEGTYVKGAKLSSDEFLYRWRVALVRVFQPDNIGDEGNMPAERPLCIWSHIDESELRWVCSDPPSLHELMEATLELRQWAMTHFSPHEVERLLAL